MVLTGQLSSGMLDEYNYHYDKYDQIEEYDDKDRSQESTKNAVVLERKQLEEGMGTKAFTYCRIYCW